MNYERREAQSRNLTNQAAGMWWKWYRRRLDVLGTGGGWLVERNGRTVALLTDPQYIEMFWNSWRLEPLTDDPQERQAVFSAAYLVSRSRRSNDLPQSRVFKSLPTPPSLLTSEMSRLVMRGLYQPISGPWLWDRLALAMYLLQMVSERQSPRSIERPPIASGAVESRLVHGRPARSVGRRWNGGRARSKDDGGLLQSMAPEGGPYRASILPEPVLWTLVEVAYRRDSNDGDETCIDLLGR